MGTIISSKKKGNCVVLEILSEYEEYLQLKGHLESIYLIPEKTAEIQTNISQRGKNEATKYFLIPRQLRQGFRFDNSTCCQRLDLKDRVIFVYIVNKNKINLSKREMALRKIGEKYANEPPAA